MNKASLDNEQAGNEPAKRQIKAGAFAGRQNALSLPPYSIVAASSTYIPQLANTMRAADSAEVWASAKLSPAEALHQSLALSTSAWCLLLHDHAAPQPAAMWGVAASRSAISPSGSPWLLASPRIYELSRPFMRFSRHFINLMHQDFPHLSNYVHAKNKASIRWLKWCGFTLAPQAQAYGALQQDFYKFWRIKCATPPKAHQPC